MADGMKYATSGPDDQMACGNCQHPKKVHGSSYAHDDRACRTYGCGCSKFVPSDRFIVQQYLGKEWPKWVQPGVQLRVKSTPIMREYGLGTSGKVHAGSVGTIERVDGNGWWDWVVTFESPAYGKTQVNLDDEVVSNTIRVPKKRGDPSMGDIDEDDCDDSEIGCIQKERRNMGSADRQTMHDFVRKHGVTMTCTRADSNPHMDDAGRGMDHWRCTLRTSLGGIAGRKATIVFSMGFGHHGKQPEAADVLNSMAIDCSSVRNSNGWEDFASEMGMLIDEPEERRKAKRMFKACERECEQLVQLFNNDTGIVEELLYETESL